MADTTVTKTDGRNSPVGAKGQKYLVSGTRVALRLWTSEPPGEPKPASRRDYETVGYVLGGRAELHVEGQMVLLNEGDAWVVPEGAEHSYRILEEFTAIEATSPPAQVHGRSPLELQRSGSTIATPIGRWSGSFSTSRFASKIAFHFDAAPYSRWAMVVRLSPGCTT